VHVCVCVCVSVCVCVCVCVYVTVPTIMDVKQCPIVVVICISQMTSNIEHLSFKKKSKHFLFPHSLGLRER
jgi:hypothetical protein